MMLKVDFQALDHDVLCEVNVNSLFHRLFV